MSFFKCTAKKGDSKRSKFAEDPLSTHNRSNSSHFVMQRWLLREVKNNNRNERKSAHSQLKCSPADNTHPTLKPRSRRDAWLRSGRLIPTYKAADHLNITGELAYALHQRANWTRQQPIIRNSQISPGSTPILFCQSPTSNGNFGQTPIMKFWTGSNRSILNHVLTWSFDQNVGWFAHF